MGLFDSVLGAAMSSIGGNQTSNSNQNLALQLVLQLIQQKGGIGNLLLSLQQSGLGDIVQSWISAQSSNQSISASQIESALGSQTVQSAAQQVGVDISQAGNLLAQYLPQIIDSLTPNGQADEAHGLSLESIAKSALQSFLK